ncbi:MAG: hypothetical protein PVI03_04010 [Candidatus Thorarchaeota archaeon]|jgi:hypothetical protein
MLVKQQIAILGGDLGRTTKMPGHSFGLSTDHCNAGTKLREVCGSVCESCYARRLEKIRPSVRKGHDARTEAVIKATESKAGMENWVSAMVERLSKKLDGRFFRWHDSGDLINVAHLDMICRVARALPDVRFWLPTKEKKILREYTRKRLLPINLVVRVSSAMVDAPPLEGYAFTSTVHKNKEPLGHVCPAPQQGGECGECRACWSHDVFNVSYHKH